MRIAIYGKGGIGKSTIAANISALLCKNGHSVLQIGCDPKHDSTLMLLNEEPKTILSGLGSLDKMKLSEYLKSSQHGIDCIEIGGPEPGVGCAGRGIVKGLEIIRKLGVYQKEYDYILYDILGDVVCGGFFEPLKNGSVDQMYIVTSGEFNSLFAANNLCKGYINCRLQTKGVKLGGIIANCRGIDQEETLIKRFCEMTNIPLVALIPRDNRIERCTFEGVSVAEAYQNADIIVPFQKIVEQLYSSGTVCSAPHSLELSELRLLCKEIRFSDDC